MTLIGSFSRRSAWLAAGLAAMFILAFAPGIARATFPGDNGLIAYSSFVPEDGGSQIYVVNSDGTDVRQVTPSGEGNDFYEPALSPESQRIVYTSFDGSVPQGDSPVQLRAINPDGTGDVALTSGPVTNYQGSWSPDGEKIVYFHATEGPETGIWLMNADGTGKEQLIQSCCGLFPVFSPDGTKIAFLGGSTLEIMNADGSDQETLAFDVADSFGRPSFSPDGDRIAFYSFGSELVPEGIHSIAIDGTDEQLEVERQQQGNPVSPSYSPDGESVGYIYREFASRSTVPAGFGINVGDLTTGVSTNLDVPQSLLNDMDWGNVPVVPPPTCETDPSLCPPPPPTCATDPSLCPPPPPPAECKTRFTKARFFVFKNKPVYRLVAKYWSQAPGEVEISFFAKNADGSKGKSLGKLTHGFKKEGSRFRVSKTVGKQRIKQLRRSKHGFVADFKIKAIPPEYCEMSASLPLTELKRVKNQFVWFIP